MNKTPPTSANSIVADEFSTEQTREYQLSEGLQSLPSERNISSKTDKDAKLDEKSSDVSSTDVDKEDDKGQNAKPLGASNDKFKVKHHVRHQVAIPPNYPYVPISEHVPPKEPARVYPFELDPFQVMSIYSIQREESVLVSAHTSAGKTVVAEYAIAHSLKKKQRVIYTSPIKALSNQKYRELSAEFGDVGLITGDITINPGASCIVMTTEILRSLLYRGSEIIHEVAWVIYDEIHYMRDKERGVVWEESIILLPSTIHFVFLSATVPNAMQFAEWICQTHKQPCHVVYTDFRPTPLQHYVFPTGGSGIHLIVDEKSNFKEDNFTKAMAVLNDPHSSSGTDADVSSKKGKYSSDSRNARDTSQKSDVYKIVKMIMSKKYDPLIVFSFNKRECEEYALKLSKLDLNSESEKEMVREVFSNAISSLSEADRKLPQIDHIQPLLCRGIGIHHSGLLPILKEVIEILFQEGLLKVLFATETFAIGLNMPAKTVVFTSIKKFDGNTLRNVSSGEYIQMSGRAGRRGLDERGIVITMVDSSITTDLAKSIFLGQADRLDSAFHLTYNMIVNLLCLEEISPEYILERSFFQFQTVSAVPELTSEIQELEAQIRDFELEDEGLVSEYSLITRKIKEYEESAKTFIQDPKIMLPFLQSGRLVHVKTNNVDLGWGVVVKYLELKNSKYSDRESPRYTAQVLVVTGKRKRYPKALGIDSSMAPPAEDEEWSLVSVDAQLACIAAVSHIRIFLPNDIESQPRKLIIKKSLEEVERRFPDGIPLLDPIEHMHIKDEEYKTLIRKIQTLESKLVANPLHGSPKLRELLDNYDKKLQLHENLSSKKAEIEKAQSIIKLEDLKKMKSVLRRLNFIDEEDIVLLKGRAACRMTSGDELVLTEMIFNGHFNDLTPEVLAATLSCFCYDEKISETVNLPENLQTPYKTIISTVREIIKVCLKCQLEIDEHQILVKFNPSIMLCVYAWAKGAQFSEISKMSQAFEGSLIRAFRRLEELILELVTAAEVIGNTDLMQKFRDSAKLIHRDIVFSASLYL